LAARAYSRHEWRKPSPAIWLAKTPSCIVFFVTPHGLRCFWIIEPLGIAAGWRSEDIQEWDATAAQIVVPWTRVQFCRDFWSVVACHRREMNWKATSMDLGKRLPYSCDDSVILLDHCVASPLTIRDNTKSRARDMIAQQIASFRQIYVSVACNFVVLDWPKTVSDCTILHTLGV
jgi:hypothetical protein